jgi:hypothetical protein
MIGRANDHLWTIQPTDWERSCTQPVSRFTNPNFHRVFDASAAKPRTCESHIRRTFVRMHRVVREGVGMCFALSTGGVITH